MRTRTMDGWRCWAEKLCRFLSQYRWLLDAYVIEYFTEGHWSKLPASWQRSLRGTLPSVASQLLLSSHFQNHRSATVDRVHPLSLLAFVAAAHSLSLQRRPSRQLSGGGTEDERRCGPSRKLPQMPGLDHIFRRHVKPKKQHEILTLAQEVVKIVEATGCRNILVSDALSHKLSYSTLGRSLYHLQDIGSGQGHLARYLAYHCGLRVVTVDAVSCHLTTAAKFDSEVERDMVRKVKKLSGSDSVGARDGSITHVQSLIQPDVSLGELLSQLGLGDSPTGTGSTSFILVGLHTCGDLAPTILRGFTQSQRVVGVLSVGCCFMKLSCRGDASLGSQGDQELSQDKGHSSTPSWAGEQGEGVGSGTSGSEVGGSTWGYPMSRWLSGLPTELTGLSYAAREAACHSIDSYRERVTDSSHHVKVHCHRAAVETLLIRHGLRRSQVKISRETSRLPFSEYASAVLKSLELPLSDLERDGDGLAAMLREWSEVGVFFMLRLALAPCVETILLLDRLLFLSELGCGAELKAVFDPALSPRNLLISSLKSQSDKDGVEL